MRSPSPRRAHDRARRRPRASRDARGPDFLVGLLTHEDVDPYLAVVRPRDREGMLAEIERSRTEPQQYGRFVIEVLEDGDWRRAGSMGFDVANRRSRIANLGGLAVHPAYRGRRLSDEAARLFQRHLLDDLGYHRLQLEIYAFNERAIRHAERAGFVREGVRRKAYDRTARGSTACSSVSCARTWAPPRTNRTLRAESKVDNGVRPAYSPAT